MAEDEAPARGGGNFLTKKLGPMPVWAYGAIGLGLVGVLYLAKKRKSATATAAAPTAAPVDTSGSAGYSNTGGYDQSSADSVLGQLEQNLGQTNQSLQNGVQLNPTGTSQVQQAVGTTPVVLASNQPVAPIQAPSTAQQYVTAQYQSILGRAPDASGLAYWTQRYQQNPAAEQAAFYAASQQGAK